MASKSRYWRNLHFLCVLTQFVSILLTESRFWCAFLGNSTESYSWNQGDCKTFLCIQYFFFFKYYIHKEIRCTCEDKASPKSLNLAVFQWKREIIFSIFYENIFQFSTSSNKDSVNKWMWKPTDPRKIWPTWHFLIMPSLTSTPKAHVFLLPKSQSVCLRTGN